MSILSWFFRKDKTIKPDEEIRSLYKEIMQRHGERRFVSSTYKVENGKMVYKEIYKVYNAYMQRWFPEISILPMPELTGEGIELCEWDSQARSWVCPQTKSENLASGFSYSRN